MMLTLILIIRLKDCELTFSEASSILSSFKIGGFDTIYIHALDSGVCGK